MSRNLIVSLESHTNDEFTGDSSMLLWVQDEADEPHGAFMIVRRTGDSFSIQVEESMHAAEIVGVQGDLHLVSIVARMIFSLFDPERHTFYSDIFFDSTWKRAPISMVIG